MRSKHTRQAARRLVSTLTAALLAAAVMAAPVRAAEAGADGKALFGEYCGMCHRANGMGTNLLARRYPADRAQLEARDDLSAAFVQAAARSGIGNMPRIARGEVSAPQLASIAAYLARGRP